MDKIIPLLSDLPARAIEEILGAIEVKEIEKGEILLNLGQICNHLYLVDQGLLRMYFISNNGKEMNMEFSKEGEFLTSIKSFYEKVPTDVAIQSLEDGRLYTITRENLNFFYDKYPVLNKIGRLITEQNFVRREMWHTGKYMMDAKTRYYNFVETQTDLVQRIPLNHLASFLGMSKEHLSRIRSEN